MLTQNSSGIDAGFDFLLLLSVVSLCMQTMVLQYARWSVAWKTAVPWKKKSCPKHMRRWTPKRANLTNHLHQLFCR